MLLKKAALFALALSAVVSIQPASAEPSGSSPVIGASGYNNGNRGFWQYRWKSEASFGKGGKRFRTGATPVDELVRFHTVRAERGDVRSIHKLADLYLVGRGVPRDLAKAASLYKTASDAGYRWSTLKYGAMLADGRGVRKDPVEARRLLGLAQQTNNSWAMYRLSKMNRKDDPEGSRRLLELSAKKGNVQAKNDLARWKK